MPLAQRAFFLAGITDPVVRAEVESLFEAVDGEDYLGSAAMSGTAALISAAAANSAAERYDAGTRISDYEVVRFIGAGGFGAVYEAVDLRDGARVALKLLHPYADRALVRRFMREARLLTSLQHPNIVRVIRVCQEGSNCAIAMEFVAGPPLSTVLADKGVLTPAVTIGLGVGIAAALEAAHKLGIIHRDLKPANILIVQCDSSCPSPKLLDFGAAKVAADSVEATTGSASATGSLIGTPAYMSPEQAEGDPLDARSDIFSLGAVLYEMVCGVRAFERRNTLTTLSAVIREQPRPLSEAAPGVPPQLAELIHRCLRKDPRMRFSGAASVRRALERIQYNGS